MTQEIQNRTVEILAKMIAEEDGIDPERLAVESKLSGKVQDSCTTSHEYERLSNSLNN